MNWPRRSRIRTGLGIVLSVIMLLLGVWMVVAWSGAGGYEHRDHETGRTCTETEYVDVTGRCVDLDVIVERARLDAIAEEVTQ